MRSKLLFFGSVVVITAVANAQHTPTPHAEPRADNPPPACQCGATSNLARVRKNVDCLTDQELNVLKHAFQIVIDRSTANPNDKKGYAYQVRIHGDRRVGPCEHGSELIWPWHRAFLFYFENLLREADPDNATLSTKNLTLPYWDWTKPPSGQGGYPKAYEDPTSPLFHAGRNAYSATNPPTLFTDSDIGLDLADWYLFGGLPKATPGQGQLERITHNDGHSVYVGGDMSDPSISVKDPIFWAHHANLDRLWDQWQQRHGQNPDGQTETLRGWDNTFTPKPIVSNFNDIRGQLQYDYCSPAPTRVADLHFRAGVEALPKEDKPPLSLKFKLADLKTALPPVRHSRAQVRLTGVKTPVDTSYQVRVFLHPSNVVAKPDSPEFVAKYLAARFTMWKMGGDHGGDDTGTPTHPPTQSIYLDVTPKYEELTRDLPADAELTVSFDFAELSGGKKKKVRHGEAGIDIQAATLVVNPKPPAH
jgi:hypothetical protein